jgi:hypothetical protein
VAGVGKLTTTDHHPFYDITQAAFVDASQLRPGDRLQEPGGRTAEILDVREDRLLAHLPALYILLVQPDPAHASPSAADVIDHLREEKITLTYDPETRSLRANAPEGVKITVDYAR